MERMQVRNGFSTFLVHVLIEFMNETNQKGKYYIFIQKVFGSNGVGRWWVVAVSVDSSGDGGW